MCMCGYTRTRICNFGTSRENFICSTIKNQLMISYGIVSPVEDFR